MEWCEEFDLFYHDVSKDVAFCYLCMRCENEKFLRSAKRDLASISRGFIFWKEVHIQEASSEPLPS